MKNIDLTHIIKNGDSKLLKSFPDFVIKILEKIIRQKKLNQIMNKYSEFEGVDFLPKVIEELNIKIEVEGQENLPENGRCVFVANHPFGMVDALSLIHTIAHKYGNVKAIGNEVFIFIPNLKPIIANVSVFGKNSRKNMNELESVYASDVPITNFPYGLVSRIHNFKIHDLAWKKSFITKAISSQRNVVPIKFYGRNSILFYTVYLIRKALGIKATLELALLPREMFKKKGKTIKMKIGKPIPYQTFDNSLTHNQWAQWLRSEVYNLNKK
jgi:putative hemolysin